MPADAIRKDEQAGQAADNLVPGGWRIALLAFALKTVPPLRYLWLRRTFLKKSGFVASAWANVPVDAAGRPLAWYTYAALHFLEPRLKPEMRVFEFGAGHSTLWWAARVATVRSIESDPAWVEKLRPKLPVMLVSTSIRLKLTGRMRGPQRQLASALISSSLTVSTEITAPCIVSMPSKMMA
jgi:hypothetical protein